MPVFGGRGDRISENLQAINHACASDFRGSIISPGYWSRTSQFESYNEAGEYYNDNPSWWIDAGYNASCPSSGTCASDLTNWWEGCIRDRNGHPAEWSRYTNIMGSEGDGISAESKDQINQLQTNYELCGGQLTLNEDTIPCEDGCVGG
jgi:hypothetical protein